MTPAGSAQTATVRAKEARSGGAVAGLTLANYWHPVAIADEVGDQPKRFTVLGEDIVVFRDREGVVALRDLCIHRGTSLALGSITDGRLRCAYHGWEYDRTGACVRIPALPEGSPIPRKARATSYQATDAYGLVWVALAEPVARIPPWPQEEYDDPGFRTVFAYRQVWSTSAGRALENFMDVSHFAFVHTGLLGSLDDTLVEPHEVKTTEYGFAYDLHQEEANSDLKGLTLREYRVYFPFTAYIRRIAPDGQASVISLTATPVSKKRTELFMFISRNHSFETDDKSFTDFNDKVMAQDRAIVESQRPEEIPLDLREELHVKVPDAAAIAFRRLLGQLDNVEDHMP